MCFCFWTIYFLFLRFAHRLRGLFSLEFPNRLRIVKSVYFDQSLSDDGVNGDWIICLLSLLQCVRAPFEPTKIPIDSFRSRDCCTATEKEKHAEHEIESRRTSEIDDRIEPTEMSKKTRSKNTSSTFYRTNRTKPPSLDRFLSKMSDKSDNISVQSSSTSSCAMCAIQNRYLTSRIHV